MKQILQNYKTGVLSVENVPPPSVSDETLIIKNSCSLISSGTERSTVNIAKKNLFEKARERPDLVKKVINQVKKDGLMQTSKLVFNRLDSDAALGYSCTGIVQELGKNIDKFIIGQRVACAGQNFASHAEIISVPKNLCVAVPENVSDEEASFVTLGAIALQGVRQTDPSLGDVVVVMGLGLLGLITVQLLNANGCKVYASDIDPAKLDLAKSLGAIDAVTPNQLEALIESVSKGMGCDSVIITASTKSNQPIEQSGKIARRKANITVVGNVGMDIPRDDYYAKELELKLSMSYGPGRYDDNYELEGIDYPYEYVRWTENRNLESFLELISMGKICLKRLITHRFELDDAKQAYELLQDENEKPLGMLIKYSKKSDNTKKIYLDSESPPKKICLGIIGSGNHVQDRLLPHLNNDTDIDIYGICTSTGIKAKKIAKKYNARICSTDYDDLLNTPEINTVIIGTRHNTHAEIVLKALKAKKNIFVEKPLCLTIKELNQIKSYIEKQNKCPKVFVGFNRRFSHHAQKVKEHFSDKLSPLTMIYRVNAGHINENNWIQKLNIGGGRIIGETCHFIDLMQFVCGSRVIGGKSVSISNHPTSITNDKVIITLQFADGSIGSLLYTADASNKIEKERFECHGGSKSAIIKDFKTTVLFDKESSKKINTQSIDKGFKQEITAFKRMLIDNTECMSLEDIFSVSKICIECSDQLNKF